MPARAETLALEADLKAFLAEATLAYAEGSMIEYDGMVGGGKMAVFSSGSFDIRDKWDQSPDSRTFNGNEEVFNGSELIWKAAYHGTIAEDADPDQVLATYAEALKQPAPELPIRGPRRLQIGEDTYTLDSVRGPLSIARFAVVDQIHHAGKRVYDGHIAGGWMA